MKTWWLPRFPYRTRDLPRERRYRRLVLLAVLTNASFLFAWSTLTPTFSAPDEHAHINSIMRVQHGGGWPAPGVPRLSVVVEQAMSESHLGTQLARSPKKLSELPPIWEVGSPSVTARATDDSVLTVGGNDRRDQMTQHPPLFYLVQAATAKLVGLDNSLWVDNLLLARLMTVLFCVPIPLIIAMAAREWGLGALVSSSVAFLPLLIPQFAFANSAVTNDALAVLLGSLALWLAIRGFRRGHTLFSIAIVGTVVGVGLLTKGTLLPVSVVVTALVLLGTSRGERLKQSLIYGVVVFVTGAWWWFMNIVRYGELQPDGLNVSPHVRDDHSPELGSFLREGASDLSQTYFGYFGRLEVPYLPRFSELFCGLLIAITLTAVAVAKGWRDRVGAALLFGATALAIPLILRSSYVVYLRNGLMPGLQGRYLFVSILAVALLCGIAIYAFPRTIAKWLAASLVAGSVLNAALGFFKGFQGYYQAPWETKIEGFSRWGDWSMYPTPWLYFTVVLLSIVTLGSVLGSLSILRERRFNRAFS